MDGESMSGAYTVAGLLFALDAVGVAVSLDEDGQSLNLSGKGRPPADLLEEVKALKPDLLAWLKGQLSAKEEASAGAPLFSPGVSPQSGENLPEDQRQAVMSDTAFFSPEVAKKPAAPLPDWAAEAAKPGRCGSCARSKPAPEWGPLMVSCTCDPVAWWPMPEPLALHIGARCGAYLREGDEVGRGWRAKAGGATWGALPLSPDDRQTDGQGAA